MQVIVPGVSKFKNKMMDQYYDTMNFMVVMIWDGDSWTIQFPDISGIYAYVLTLKEGCDTCGPLLQEVIIKSVIANTFIY